MKQMRFLTCDVNPLNFWVTDWWAAGLTGCCLWVRSKVIACFVTFPCKLKLMALINFWGIQNYSVTWWLFDIVPLSHSDKDNCIKLAPWYWLFKFNRRTNDRVVACLEMTLQSTNIRHPLTVMTLLTTSVVWHCACCSQSSRLDNCVLVSGGPDVPWCCAEYHMDRLKKCDGSNIAYTNILSFSATRGSVQLRQGLGNLMQMLLEHCLSSQCLCVRTFLLWEQPYGNSLFSTFECCSYF